MALYPETPAPRGVILPLPDAWQLGDTASPPPAQHSWSWGGCSWHPRVPPPSPPSHMVTTHIAIVNVEDMDFGGRLHLLYAGPVPGKQDGVGCVCHPKTTCQSGAMLPHGLPAGGAGPPPHHSPSTNLAMQKSPRRGAYEPSTGGWLPTSARMFSISFSSWAPGEGVGSSTCLCAAPPSRSPWGCGRGCSHFTQEMWILRGYPPKLSILIPPE